MKPNSLSFNLEPTFRCNLQCEMCPRFSSEDPKLDMSEEVYDRIVAEMTHAHTVDFTGWGEPMLHPRIYRMVSQAVEQGCTPTMTSNGTVLTERNREALIDAGMGHLTVSIDGLTPFTFDQIRIGASFEKVTANLERLVELIARRHSPLQLGIAFTIQESNAAELDLLVPWLRRVGARILHLKQLNVISNKEDWERGFLKYRLLPGSAGPEALLELEERMLAVRDEAEGAGLSVKIHSELPLQSSMEGRHCLATPLDSVYFSFEGRVAPCCHFGHHVSRYFEGEQYPAQALFFGDIRSSSLEEIWTSESFVQFRSGFITRHYPEACRSCYLLYGK